MNSNENIDYIIMYKIVWPA